MIDHQAVIDPMSDIEALTARPRKLPLQYYLTKATKGGVVPQIDGEKLRKSPIAVGKHVGFGLIPNGGRCAATLAILKA